MGFFCSKRCTLFELTPLPGFMAIRCPDGQQRGPLFDVDSKSPSGLPNFTALITTLKSVGLISGSSTPMQSVALVLLVLLPSAPILAAPAAPHTTLTSEV